MSRAAVRHLSLVESHLTLFVSVLRSQWLAKGAKVAISGRRREVVAKAVRPIQTGSAAIDGEASNEATA